MITSPIIPIWLMAIISVIMLFIVLKNHKTRKLPLIEIAVIIILFLMNIRVMIPSDKATILSSDLDVLFVIDTTVSMEAQDYDNKQTRLSKVKEDCEYIIKQLNGARFSIISFANNSYLLTPFINDTSLTIDTINSLHTVDEFYAKGSSLNTPIKEIKDALEYSKEKKDRVSIIFFISDGEITDDSKLKSYESLKDSINGGAVLGYGTEKGGYIQVTDYYTEEKKYLTYYDSNYNEKKAISKLDENNLQSIANDLKIDYIHMSTTKSIDSKIKEITKMSKQSSEDTNKASYTDTYYLLCIPLIVLLYLIYKKYKEEYTI